MRHVQKFPTRNILILQKKEKTKKISNQILLRDICKQFM